MTAHSDDPVPATGPQLTDADLTQMDTADLYRLATAVAFELRTVETTYAEGTVVSSDELLWVRADAETVQAEFERRGDTVQVDNFSKVLDQLDRKSVV